MPPSQTAPRTAGRSWWGWGTTDHALSDEECAARGAVLPGLPDRPRPVPDLADVVLPTSRVTAPDGLPVSTDPADRARPPPPTRPPGPATPTARPTATSSARCRASCPGLRTPSPIPPTSTTSC